MPAFELPRLTGSLRAFSGLSSPVKYDSQNGDDLVKKRKWKAQQEAKKGFTWQKLAEIFEQRIPKGEKENAKRLLRELKQVASRLVGGEVTEGVDTTAALLFYNLKDCEQIGHKETIKLKKILGPFPASEATKACEIVQKLTRLVPEECLDTLGKTEVQSTADTGKEFGANIKFSFPVKNELIESDDDEDLEDSESSKLWNTRQETAFPQAETSPTPEGIDALWLRKECEKYFGNREDLSVLDMCSTIFEVLSSSRSSEEIQEDLFDLVGFDQFEFIESLLSNREKIVSATMENASGYGLRKGKGGNVDSGNSLLAQQRPTYGCQVVIQSEQEKQFLKATRREEKKLMRKLDRPMEDIEHEEYLRALGFDPEEMRDKREAALQHAATIPLFSKRERASQPREMYPHVYDSMLEAQQMSSFVAGSKILLPSSAQRNTTRLYEEVIIPPDGGAALTIGENFVSVSDLDDIGQMAFQGTKKLNRIQSIVYDAAYHTNQNLLICAPTGAGKTNIAMLTILHEIKQNIQQGVIKKDQFKVVYIAPMKALAAEMVANFGKRLAPLGIVVKELTGDMQLTKAEILKTQMLVTTPEKWDVVTRKSTGDVALAQLVKLLIIDEVHLLHDDRGSVIECLVARTLRQVESSQSMIRIVGLSATLPNYLDVATFLHVNPYQGLFFFDGRFRPVPLGQTFIGVKATGVFQRLQNMDTVCYEKALDNVQKGHQVMVFVHARNATVRTAMTLREMAANQGDAACFRAQSDPQFGLAQKQVMRSRNKELRDLFQDGFSIHHAGMLRQDRSLVENLFSKGLIKVLVCTATLAWGVNLPAHAVIIKGTEIYDAKKGSFVDLGILDVLQIFGRAGRPQFDTHGEGTIITSHDKLAHYLSLLTRQSPIESQLQASLTDSLNAEISLGTVTNMEEGVQWLSYTYLFTRMLLNPLVYGLSHDARELDPMLEKHREVLISNAAKALDKARMVRYDERTGYLSATDLGRTASNFYIKYATVEVFNEMFKAFMTEADILGMISHSQEFEQIKVRDEEIPELQEHMEEHCIVVPKGGVENAYGKVNILMQTYVSQAHVDAFSLVSDQAYVAQNAGRIVRALFEIALHKGWPTMTAKLLKLSITLDKRLWGYENHLKQFSILNYETLSKLEARKLTIDRLREMDAKEIGHMIHHPRMGNIVKKCAKAFPSISLAASIQPITRTVLRVRLDITPEFIWDDKVHGSTSEPWWIWVEDPDNNHIYHNEYFLIQKKQVQTSETQSLVFTIPIFEPLPPQYYVRAISDRWLGAETACPISFQHLILPEKHPPHTDLLDLQPLSVTALGCPEYEALFSFTHFNPIQTQIFHTLYHSDHNVLLGAPTGSGKTIAAELAIFRIFNVYPKTKAVYIAPLKALVRERIDDWRIRFEEKLGKKVIELTGDVTPDIRAIGQADVIVTTPEKWDAVSRSWQNRSYVKAVTLLVIDEIHLLGNDRGPVLEVIVSRTNFISSHTECGVRVVGLSTALANARDLADWLNIGQAGLFNFRPSVRPVPLEVHIHGFPGKHYCPRMATMNKPAFAAIRTHSPAKPVLIFVSSRRQTRLTALDLIAYLAAEDDPKQWLNTPEHEMDNLIRGIHDDNLKLSLSFGIGLHHAGLHERDRKTVEELFVNQKIQVLIATSTLAWGVNFPAHLVIVKGTEYFDGKISRYVDFPITDVLQMMGRAGRPQYDDHGVAVILVQDVKKHFYKKFLYEPFPVESNLLEVLSDHLNAEVVSGTVTSKQDAMDYITWTYFFRRLVMNPSYYDLDDTDTNSINTFLSQLVQKSIQDLEMSYCLDIAEDNRGLSTTTLGRIASYYYLSHRTVRMFRDRMFSEATVPDLLKILTDAEEYAELPVRHNEDGINSDLAKQLPLEVDPYSYDSPHTKAHLLFQAHFCRATLPSSDYYTDTKSVLDQAIRILQAMIDVAADEGWLATALQCMCMVQMIAQGRWLEDSTLLTLPWVEEHHLKLFKDVNRHEMIDCLPELLTLLENKPDVLRHMIRRQFSVREIDEIHSALCRMPQMNVKLSIQGIWAEDGGSMRVEKPVFTNTEDRRAINWVPVHADQEYVIRVNLSRITFGNRRPDRRAHAPRFPKVKDEAWWFVLGEVDTGELIALKRVGFISYKSTVSLAFYTPEDVGPRVYTLFIMSDAYLGLDQQYDIPLDVIEADITCQINSEVNLEDD